MLKRLYSNRLYLALGPLALTAPFTSFLRFYDIPFLSSEALYSFAIISTIGLLAGLVMALGGNLTQALISSVIIVLIICSETPTKFLYPEGIRFRYIFFLSIFLVGVLLFFLREQRIRILLILFGGMWLVGAVSPSSFMPTQVIEKSYLPDTSLPPYVHIVLDEHIGIEGIPPSFDKNHNFSLKIKNKYIDQGFLTFGRAYSRFQKTEPSFASFLNFQSLYDANIFMNDEITFAPNKLFDALDKRGYVINIFASDVGSFNATFCKNKNSDYRIGKCVIASNRGLKIFHDEFLILHNYVKKMRLLNMYDVIRKKLGTPETNITMYPHILEVIRSANEFIDFLGEGKRGNAYFIHLLLPHSPYFLNENCSYNYDGNFFIKEKIDAIYARYLKQTQCAHTMVDKILNKLKSNKETKDSTIIVHGDHGSRIPWNRDGTVSFSTEEYIQYFSTLFTIRSPTVTPGYDRRPFALDELLKVFSASKPDFLTLDNKNEKFVYSFPKRGASKRLAAHQKFTLPPFANGSRAQAW